MPKRKKTGPLIYLRETETENLALFSGTSLRFVRSPWVICVFEYACLSAWAWAWACVYA